MEDSLAKTILTELRDFRKENDRKWEQNEKRWVENNKKWEQNEKCWVENNRKWEQNEKRWEENNRKWEQNEKRWEENNKKWEQNEKRWEENNKKWEQNEKCWEENNKKWEQNEKRWLENDKKWNQSETQRKKDRDELIEVLDTMDKSITRRFDYIGKYIDSRYDKILEDQFKCNKEYILLRREFETQKARINFQNVRIESLEKWRDNLGDDFVGIS